MLAPGVGAQSSQASTRRGKLGKSKLLNKKVEHKSFLQSLRLTDRQADDLAKGNFLYVRRKKGLMQDAYNMEVVDHLQIDPHDHYTISKGGVTHFTGDESEFTPLEQWEREYRAFNRMQRIPFFAKYRAWKSFIVWKKNVRGAKCSAASKNLKGKLFLLDPMLRTALMRLRKLCYAVSELRLFEYNAKSTATLDDFCNQQSQKRSHVMSWIAEFSDDVRSLVRGAADEVLDKFLAENSIQADQKMTFMERAALRTECRRLTKFIRLADFLVRECAPRCVVFRMAVVLINGCGIGADPRYAC